MNSINTRAAEFLSEYFQLSVLVKNTHQSYMGLFISVHTFFLLSPPHHISLLTSPPSWISLFAPHLVTHLTPPYPQFPFHLPPPSSTSFLTLLLIPPLSLHLPSPLPASHQYAPSHRLPAIAICCNRGHILSCAHSEKRDEQRMRSAWTCVAVGSSALWVLLPLKWLPWACVG